MTVVNPFKGAIQSRGARNQTHLSVQLWINLTHRETGARGQRTECRSQIFTTGDLLPAHPASVHVSSSGETANIFRVREWAKERGGFDTSLPAELDPTRPDDGIAFV